MNYFMLKRTPLARTLAASVSKNLILILILIFNYRNKIVLMQLIGHAQEFADMWRLRRMGT